MPSEEDIQVATFKLRDQLYGVELGYVQEFVEKLNHTILPDHDKKYVALANLRGQIISLLDVKYLLNGESSEDFGTLMIIRNNRSLAKSKLNFDKQPTSKEAIGLVIEERGRIMSIKSSSFSSAPDHGAIEFSKYYKGVLEFEGELLILLDLTKMIGLQSEGVKVESDT